MAGWLGKMKEGATDALNVGKKALSEATDGKSDTLLDKAGGVYDDAKGKLEDVVEQVTGDDKSTEPSDAVEVDIVEGEQPEEIKTVKGRVLEEQPTVEDVEEKASGAKTPKKKKQKKSKKKMKKKAQQEVAANDDSSSKTVGERLGGLVEKAVDTTVEHPVATGAAVGAARGVFGGPVGMAFGAVTGAIMTKAGVSLGEVAFEKAAGGVELARHKAGEAAYEKVTGKKRPKDGNAPS